MINNKEQEQKYGLMELNMKEIIKMVVKKVMEHYILQMDPNIKDSFLKMKYMDMENMNGLMEEYIKVIGNKIK